MQTTIYTQPSAFDQLAAEWDDLLERSVNAPFFMRHLYQQTWWQHLGNDDLALIAIRTDSGQLVGLAPLYGKTTATAQRELNFVGCVDVSDYLDMLVDREYIEPVYQALLDCLAGLTWDKLYLCSLPYHSISQTQFAQAVAQPGASSGPQRVRESPSGRSSSAP